MGGWGRDWMSVTGPAPEVETVAWVDPDPAARAATLRRGPTPALVFADLDDALDAVKADAALVTTALPGHVPVALAALDAGLHVLLEKPFGPTLADAVEVVRRAHASGRSLAINQNYRFHPAPRLAARLVADGEIGEVVAVEIDFRRPLIRRQDVLDRHRGIDHPLLVDMSIHHFDLLRLVLGVEPERVHIEAINPPWSEYRDPPAGYGTLVFGTGIVVSYRGSWISAGARTPWAGVWRIDGTDGSIELSSRGDPGVRDVVRIRRPGRGVQTLPLPDVGPIDRHGALASFAAAVATGEEPEVSGRRNLPTLALTLAAVRSATERRPVDVAELLADIPEDLR